MAAPVILLEASPRRVDGSIVQVRLAGGGGARPYDYNGENWRAGIVSLPTIIAAVDFEAGSSSVGDFGTGGIPQAAQIEWGGSDRDELAALAGYIWADAPVTLRLGPEGNLPPVLLKGTAMQATAEKGRLRIALADPAAALKKPLLTRRFAGTGGIEGPLEWEGRIRRRLWGRVWNVPGAVIDSANNIHCFADPEVKSHSFLALRHKGAPAAAMPVLAWQGSVAATFAALQAADVPQGGGVVCPSINCVKWWMQIGDGLHADMRGEIGTGFVETVPEIAERIIALAGGPGFTAGTVAAAKALRPGAAGWLVDDDRTSPASILDELLSGVSLLWVLEPAGKIAIKPWSWGAPVTSARAIRVNRAKSFRPMTTRRIGYRRNQSPMSRGDLAAIVLYSDVDGSPKSIADISPVESAKLAGIEDGANVTGSHVAAGYAGQTAWGTLTDPVSSIRTPGANIIPNGSLRLGATGWTLSAGVSVAANGNGNYFYFSANGTPQEATSDFVPFGPGSFTFQAEVSADAGAYYHLRLSCFDASKTYIGDAGGTGFIGPSSQWERKTISGTAPAGTVFIRFRTGQYITATGTLRLRKLKVEMGGVATVFSDDATFGALYGDRTAIDLLQPQEIGSNKTETRTAGAIAGQSAWATYGRTTATLSYLDDFGRLDRLDRVLDRKLTYLYRDDGSTSLTEAAAITAMGTAAAIAGQGAFATRSSVAYGSSFLTGFGGLAPRDDIYFGSGFLRETNGGSQATLSNFRTSDGIAAGYSGQTAWGTFTAPTTRIQYLDDSGRLDRLDRVLDRKLTYLYRADGSTALTEAAAITSQGTAAAYLGQTAWGTLTDPVSSIRTPGANIIPNGSLRLGATGWTLSGGVSVAANSNGNYFYFSANGTPQEATSDFVPFGPGSFTFQAEVSADGGAHYHLRLSCFDASKTYIGDAGGTGFTGPSSQWERKTISGSAPAGTAFIRYRTGSYNTATGALRLRKLKVEMGGVATVFSDDATFGALYADRTAIDLLQPQEIGSNKTETRTASAVAGQTDWATYTGISTGNMANRVSRLSGSTGRVIDPQIYNVQSVLGPKSTTNLVPTYTASGDNWQVNLPAHIRKVAGQTGAIVMSFSSSSGVIAASTYWVAYIDLPNGFTTSGAGSVVFSSDPDALLVANRYQIASGVTPPPSSSGGTSTGGSTGTGGGAGGVIEDCVAAESWMPDGRRAMEYASGDQIRVLDETTWNDATFACVVANRLTEAPVVELTSASGIRVIVSETTPCTMMGGACVAARDALGAELAVEDEHGLRWERIVSVEPLGIRAVAHISANESTYAAGVEPGRFIYTHNAAAKP